MELQRDFQGTYYNGRSSEHNPAVLKVDDQLAAVWIEGRIVNAQPLNSLRVFPKVGNIPGRVWFHDGGTFESASDLEILDRSLSGRLTAFFGRLETSGRTVAAFSALLLFFLFLIFKVILPWGSPRLAKAMPAQTVKFMETQQLAALERLNLVQPSRSSAQERQAVESVFAELEKEFPNLDLRLKVVGGPQANAFALPAGQVLVTDEFLSQVTERDEIKAVLYHEIGHVHHRHGIQSLIENSAVSLAVSAVLGDVAGVGMMVSLAANHYSRVMESEADLFAVRQMLSHHQDPEALGRALAHLEAGQAQTNSKMLRLFSTHPPTSERIKMFHAMKSRQP